MYIFIFAGEQREIKIGCLACGFEHESDSLSHRQATLSQIISHQTGKHLFFYFPACVFRTQILQLIFVEVEKDPFDSFQRIFISISLNIVKDI